jgi:hypothetical protein
MRLAFTIAGARDEISCILSIFFSGRWPVWSHAGATFQGSPQMTISSVSAPASAAPINPVDTNAPKTSAATASADSSDTSAAHQPPPPPPLPPGQGTRVDQLA